MTGHSHDARFDPNEAAKTSRDRSGLYGFLAGLYRQEPTVAVLRRMQEPDFLEAEVAAGISLSNTLTGNLEEELLEDLAVEYTRLFIGPGKHISPYAAIYTGGDGSSLWNSATTSVQNFIRAAGFDYRPDFRDLPDHISVELEFMQHLTAREAAAWGKGDLEGAKRLRRLEARFLTEHLANWIPAFCERITVEANHPFYRALAGLTQGVIRSELQRFEELNSALIPGEEVAQDHAEI